MKKGKKMDRIMNAKEVVLATGLSRTTLKRMEDRGEFPKRVLLTEKRFGYREREVADWIAAL